MMDKVIKTIINVAAGLLTFIAAITVQAPQVL